MNRHMAIRETRITRVRLGISFSSAVNAVFSSSGSQDRSSSAITCSDHVGGQRAAPCPTRAPAPAPRTSGSVRPLFRFCVRLIALRHSHGLFPPMARESACCRRPRGACPAAGTIVKAGSWPEGGIHGVGHNACGRRWRAPHDLCRACDCQGDISPVSRTPGASPELAAPGRQ